jgi:hypothetical protein
VVFVLEPIQNLSEIEGRPSKFGKDVGVLSQMVRRYPIAVAAAQIRKPVLGAGTEG